MIMDENDVPDGCSVIAVDGLDVAVPDEWLKDGVEDATAKVKELRAKYHEDRAADGHEHAVANHGERMKS